MVWVGLGSLLWSRAENGLLNVDLGESQGSGTHVGAFIIELTCGESLLSSQAPPQRGIFHETDHSSRLRSILFKSYRVRDYPETW